MKKIYLPVIIIFAFVFVSCILSCKKNFLGVTETNSLNVSTVFADSTNTANFLGNIYHNIAVSANVARFGNGGLDAAGDEGQPGNLTPSQANYWAQGVINAAIVTDDVYRICYSQIRAVNLLMANIGKTKLHLPPDQPGSRVQMIAEARFLRAWYYAILLKHYGGIPLVGNKIYNYTDNIPVIRATYAACVKYITSECDSAAKVLPYTQMGLNYGRASGGACQALKARVLLYAASPLFSVAGNIAGPNGSFPNPAIAPLVGYTAADTPLLTTQQRWLLAKNAAYAVIASNQYQLFVDNVNKNRPGLGFQALFCNRSTPIPGFANSNEYILQAMFSFSDGGVQLENYWDPPSRGGANGAFPYQEMVDAFPMMDGKDTLTSIFKYDSQDPYANRDPRLGYSIIHDQTVLPVRLSFAGTRAPVNIYLVPGPGGTLTAPTIAGQPSSDALVLGTSSAGGGTTTGYYVNKMLDTSADGGDILHQPRRCQPMMRYAEVLLNYAEAYNESTGTDSAYIVLEKIRARAGILPGTDGLYGLALGMGQAQMRAAIQYERRIELAYEEHRFWDVRRWKIAPVTENQLFHGMQVVRAGGTPTSSAVYTIFAIKPQHVFTDRMYFWPIPQTEIGKSITLKQNPGY